MAKSRQDEQGEAQLDEGSNGAAENAEKQLAEYLAGRIKPNLNKSAIPMLARSIAKDLTKRNSQFEAAEQSDEAPAEQSDEALAQSEEAPQQSEGADEPSEGVEDDAGAESDDGAPEGSADEASEQDEGAEQDEDVYEDDDAEQEDDVPEADAADFEQEMHDLQAEIGEDWIVRFSVHNDESWLTAERTDASQRVEAENADGLVRVIEAIDEAGR